MQQRTRRHLQHPGCGHGNLIDWNGSARRERCPPRHTCGPPARRPSPPAPVLVRDDVDRDVIASALLRHRDAGDELADSIDMLSINPEARRKVVRMLAKVDAAGR